METYVSAEGNSQAVATSNRFTLIDFEPLTLPCADPLSEATRQVIFEHHRDFSSRDLDRLMRHYSPDSRLVEDTEIWQGRDAIRTYYSYTLAQLAGEHVSLRLLQLDIDRKMAFLTWEQYSDHLLIPFGATTFIVMDGQIVRQQLIACACGGQRCIHLY